MPAYILLCRDIENGFALRAETRAAHLSYINSSQTKLLLAGPLLNEHDKPIGSMLVIEADTMDAARSFANADPYAQAGLFDNVEIRPFKPVTGAFLQD